MTYTVAFGRQNVSCNNPVPKYDLTQREKLPTEL